MGGTYPLGSAMGPFRRARLRVEPIRWARLWDLIVPHAWLLSPGSRLLPYSTHRLKALKEGGEVISDPRLARIAAAQVRCTIRYRHFKYIFF